MRVETLTPYTFHSWTDGIKVVLDTYNVDHSEWYTQHINAYIGCGSFQVVHEAIEAFKSATFYYIGSDVDAKTLMDQYPDRDIRLLRIPEKPPVHPLAHWA